ncbi:MAG TPA: phage head-tail connector protein [Candidatus Sulfotelmatobacter sp.]|nr:phage head-tail connector protein [Candidatus Sulfotelmatobacter sp.]
MLTQLSTIKARLGLTDTTSDTLLTNFIKHASGRFDAHCNRSFARLEGATDEFGAERTELPLSRYPVEAVSQFECKTREGDGWEEQPEVEYLLRGQCVVSLPAALGSCWQVMRITYVGGYVLPGSVAGPGQAALPEEIEQACVEQVAYWYQHKDKLGVITSMEAGVAFYQFSQLDLLAHVKALLAKFTRWAL